MPRDPERSTQEYPWRTRHCAADADTSWKTLASKTSRRAKEGRDVQPAERRRRFRCPECGNEKTLAEADPEGEVESWENEGEVRGVRTKGRGKDSSHGRWTIDRGLPGSRRRLIQGGTCLAP